MHDSRVATNQKSAAPQKGGSAFDPAKVRGINRFAAKALCEIGYQMSLAAVPGQNHRQIFSTGPETRG
jgi:hypothetical protein